MSSYESTVTGGSLDPGGDDEMANSYNGPYLQTYANDFLQPGSMLGVGQGGQAPSPVWSTASPFQSFVASDASSLPGVSPRPDFANLSPITPMWLSPESEFGLGPQLQEAADTKLFDENLFTAIGYDPARNPSQDLLMSPESLLSWNAPTRTPQPTYIISPPVQDPIQMGSGEPESSDWTTSSRDAHPLPPLSSPLLSSPIQERDEAETTKLKEEFPSSKREGSGSSIGQSWVARRTLSKNKRLSRAKSRGSGSSGRRDSNHSIQSDFDDGDYGSSSDHATGKPRNDKSFACPFYRMDPMRHMECLGFKLSRIRDVKQHINRRHITGPHYCPECWLTFPSAEPWERHIKARSCKAPASGSRISILGVSDDMRDDLAKRVDKMLSPSQQWYTILNILFKDSTKKPNPYLGTVVEETVGMMRDYWDQDGADITRDVLRSRSNSGQSTGDLGDLMKHLFGEVQARFEQKTRQSGARESNNPQQSVLTSPGSDTTMIDTQTRSENDWCLVVKEPLPPPEMTKPPICTCGATRKQVGPGTNQPGVLLTRRPSGFAPAGHLAPFSSTLDRNESSSLIAEKSSHEQVMDESGPQLKLRPSSL